MRGPLEWLPMLMLAAWTVFAPGAAVAEPTTWCAGDFAFAVDAPEGWTVRSEETALGLALSFEPAREDGPPTAAIGVLVPRETSESAGLERSLDEWLELVGAFGSPLDTRRVEVGHPHLPTRAAAVTHRSGELYLAVAGGENGRVFHVTLARLGGPATGPELEALRGVVASLRPVTSSACASAPRTAPASDAP